MTYAIALRVFAVLLALICIGLMSFVAHYTHAPQTQTPGPNLAIHLERPERTEHAPRWPDATVRIGTVALLVSFVVLAGVCLLIAGV
ncbi:hypothetical protein [Paraburkholderia sp. J8-2]|uniref:hypothetical protein n=1 Tax=Paraburkholderia sp. J8-2 TaxID=2805440 RepID=UPI002AB6607D|nr:hypothetical protein [Paraburkholderia sp. J8-2]